jgi:site-specific DNA-methyltransferase (adenine-specific)
MPERLLGRIIEACSLPGELVLDPFTGSGTTLAVAKKLGRKYLGYELSKQYAEQAGERLKEIHAGDPLEGVADPLTSVPPTSKGRRLDQVEPGKSRTPNKSSKSKKVKDADAIS